MLTLVIALVLAMLISFTCSVLEATLLSLSNTDLAKLSEKTPRIAKIWRGFKENIQRPIAVILIINTLSHTIGATVAGSQFQLLYGDSYIWLFSLAFSYAMIQWTEILPKSLGVRYNRSLAVIIGLPMSLIVKIFKPFVFFVELINRPFSPKDGHAEKMDSVKDIHILAKFSTLNNLISEKQENIINSSLKLSNSTVEEIMIQRHEIKYLTNEMSLMDALVEAHIHHHTRYILANGNNLDDIIGYVNFKDIVNALRINPSDPSLKGISRQIIAAAPREKLNVLLSRMTKSYQHIAVVRDEQNRTLGLVTLEDLFEFMVGDIQDEFDQLPNYICQITPSRYIVGGGATLAALKNTAAGSNLPENDMTVHDFLKLKLPGNLKVEQMYKEAGCTLIIRKIRRSKVHEAILETT